MVDLKGPLIRTLGFKDMYSINVNTGQEIRISSNINIKGDEGMFVIDYENIHEKLIVGDKILVDYGGIVLTVIGFESEEKYLL
jgi:pyruvate kinase